MYQGGYQGKVLRVNLTRQTATPEPLPVQMARDYMGGAGFCIKYLFDEVKKGTPALDPGNKLIFAPGPFTGTTVPCASRMAVAAKSPLTGAVGMALTGGFFPAEMKFAGYDVLIIEGKAEKPVYLWINDDDVKFRDAAKLWGMHTSDSQQTIKNDLKDQNIRVACIGPAGENRIAMAAIINEMRAIGRKGLGAVMGSKNLKAIAIRGSRGVTVADTEKLKTARKAFANAMKESPVLYPAFAKLGTPMVVDATSALGIFPTRNFSTSGEYTPVEQIGVDVQVTRNVGKNPCHGCPVGCSQLKLARNAPYAGTLAEGPEFETMYSYGGVTGVDNIDAIIAADRLADELGIDSISSGVAVGFAMELYEKGILSDADTGGLDLRFGNHEAMHALLTQMAYRQGLGDVLADGVRAAAQKIGKGSEQYAMHVKGLELPGYDVRGAKAHGLNYATAYTGADHNRGYAFQEIFGIPIPFAVDRLAAHGKGALTKWNQDVRTATCDCPTMCAFLLDMAVPAVAAQNTADLLHAVTGIELSAQQVEQLGERVNNLAHAFNVREGFSRKDDTLPQRLMTEPLKGGASKGNFISTDDLNLMLDEYYAARGWDPASGKPTPARLKELNLEFVIADLGL